MLKQIFSLKLFVAHSQHTGMNFMEIKEAVDLWAKECDGLERQQIADTDKNKQKMLDEWFEFVEEG